MFTRTEYGFWRQDEPAAFDYTEEYTESQSTNDAMAHMRLGWIGAFLNYEALTNASVVDIGAGNGSMVKCLRDKVGYAAAYDVVGDSISKSELMETEWDLVIMSDVLEHMEELEFLQELQWKHMYLSFPETPVVEKWEDLKTWRHFKPNEHLWMLNSVGMCRYCFDHGILVLGSAYFEDLIRTRWDPTLSNIASLMLEKKRK
jgi:hypothetical protein